MNTNNPKTKERLRTFALAALFIALFLTILALLPRAAAYEQDKARNTARPLIEAQEDAQAAQEAEQAASEPSEPLAKPQKVIMATVYTYQAVPEQTDSSPCSGAMPGVDFCNPPFRIVANNCLKLGSKVEIRGEEYVVADRMASRHGCDVFDRRAPGRVTFKNEPVLIL